MASPDFEAPADAYTDNAYEVTVEVGDSDGTDAASMAVTVTVTDKLEIAGEAAVDYEENGTGDVATYTSTGDMWSLSGDDAGLFDITGGVLTFMASPDFEAPADADTDNAYEVTVEVGDSDGTDAASMAVTVTVTDAQEIEITGATAVDYEENGTVEPSGRTRRQSLALPGRSPVPTRTTSPSVVACLNSQARRTSSRRRTRTPTTSTW